MGSQVTLDDSLLERLSGKTAIVTGGASGIGAATVRLLNSKGANVVIADLDFTRQEAENLIGSLSEPSNAAFVPTDILQWSQVNDLCKEAIKAFGRIDVVVANAAIMERRHVLGEDNVTEDGEPKEPTEAYRVIDINLKGTLNTLQLGIHYLTKFSSPEQPGAITLVSSTSGYFGGTGVTAYVASKHGVTGLLRASQLEAGKKNIRVNGIAPFFTPTGITSSYSKRWNEKGLEANTPENVARAIVHTAVDTSSKGSCLLVAGRYVRELEAPYKAMVPSWLGEDLAALFAGGMKFFQEIGGYPLPQR